jgi:hypothetical protein
MLKDSNETYQAAMDWSKMDVCTVCDDAIWRRPAGSEYLHVELHVFVFNLKQENCSGPWKLLQVDEMILKS